MISVTEWISSRDYRHSQRFATPESACAEGQT